MTFAWIAIGVLAILALVEAVALLALARELGLISLRLPPTPALESGDGPELGTSLPACTATPLGGGTAHDLHGPSELSRVLLFLSSGCASCRDLIRELNGIELDWPDYEFVPVVTGPHAAVAGMQRTSRYRGTLYQDEGGEVMKAARVRATPTALVINPDGTVAAQAVVNTREMVSSLLSGHIRVNHEILQLDAAGGDAL